MEAPAHNNADAALDCAGLVVCLVAQSAPSAVLASAASVFPSVPAVFASAQAVSASALAVSASAPAVEASLPAVAASLPAVAASLPSVLAQPSADDDMDVIVGVSIGDACNLTAASQAEDSVGVGAKCLVPKVLADVMDVKVGAAISDVCNLRAAPGKLSQAEDAVGLVAKSPYQADTSVRLALLQAGASDGIQSQVSSVMT
jgi:hypothetical protein